MSYGSIGIAVVLVLFVVVFAVYLNRRKRSAPTLSSGEVSRTGHSDGRARKPREK